MFMIPQSTLSVSTQPWHSQGKAGSAQEVTFIAIQFSHFPPTDNSNQPANIALVFETLH